MDNGLQKLMEAIEEMKALSQSINTYSVNATQGGAVENSVVIQSLLSRTHTITVVQVKAVKAGGTGAVGSVDVLPLVRQVGADGKGIDNVVIYNLPYFRLQGGANAVIIDPQVGDIGLAAFASRDISEVKKTKSESTPKTKRQYDMADGLYIGGFLNGAPQQYIHFKDDGGIKVVSTGDFEVEAKGSIRMKAEGSATFESAGTMTLKDPSTITLDTPSTMITGGLIAGMPDTRSRSATGYVATFNIPVTFIRKVTFKAIFDAIDGIFSNISFLKHIHKDSIGGDTDPPKKGE